MLKVKQCLQVEVSTNKKKTHYIFFVMITI